MREDYGNPMQCEPHALHEIGCICTAARRAARAVTQLYDLILTPIGLKASQFVVLQAIHAHGEIAQHELADEYAVSIETLSRRLGTMRRSGWIQLRVGKRKREHIYSLTEKGRRVYNEAIPHWRRAHSRMLEILGSQERLKVAVDVLDMVTRSAAAAKTLRTSNAGIRRDDSDSGSTSMEGFVAGGTHS